MAYYGFPNRPVRKWPSKLVVCWKTSTRQETNLWCCTSKLCLSKTSPHKAAFVPRCLNGLCGLFEIALRVCIKGRWVKGGLFVCVLKVRAGTQRASERRSTHHVSAWDAARPNQTTDWIWRWRLLRRSVTNTKCTYKHTWTRFVTPKSQTIQTLPPNGWAVRRFAIPPLLSLFLLSSTPSFALISPLQANSIWLTKKMQERWHH